MIEDAKAIRHLRTSKNIERLFDDLIRMRTHPGLGYGGGQRYRGSSGGLRFIGEHVDANDSMLLGHEDASFGVYTSGLTSSVSSC